MGNYKNVRLMYVLVLGRYMGCKTMPHHFYGVEQKFYMHHNSLQLHYLLYVETVIFLLYHLPKKEFIMLRRWECLKRS